MDKEIYMFIYAKFQVCTSSVFNTKSKCTVIYKDPSQSRVLKPNFESNYSLRSPGVICIHAGNRNLSILIFGKVSVFGGLGEPVRAH
jgi:hypothetical protein